MRETRAKLLALLDPLLTRNLDRTPAFDGGWSHRTIILTSKGEIRGKVFTTINSMKVGVSAGPPIDL